MPTTSVGSYPAIATETLPSIQFPWACASRSFLAGDDDVNRLQQRIKDALDRIVASATASQLTDKTNFAVVGVQNLQDETMGPDVVSATSIKVTKAYHHLTGGTNVSFLAIAGTFNGFRVELACVTNTTFVNVAGSPPVGAYAIHTLTGANVTITGGKVIALRRDDSLRNWLQVA